MWQYGDEDTSLTRIDVKEATWADVVQKDRGVHYSWQEQTTIGLSEVDILKVMSIDNYLLSWN